MTPIHPGEILREDLMEPYGLSGHAIAKILDVPANRITGIVAGRRALTADTALRLERAFGVSAKFWLGLQSDFDLETAQASAKKALRRIKPFTAEAA